MSIMRETTLGAFCRKSGYSLSRVVGDILTCDGDCGSCAGFNLDCGETAVSLLTLARQSHSSIDRYHSKLRGLPVSEDTEDADD